MQEEEAEKTKKDSHRNTAACSHLEKKVVVLEFAKNHLNLGGRKIADHFGTAKTLIQIAKQRIHYNFVRK